MVPDLGSRAPGGKIVAKFGIMGAEGRSKQPPAAFRDYKRVSGLILLDSRMSMGFRGYACIKAKN